MMHLTSSSVATVINILCRFRFDKYEDGSLLPGAMSLANVGPILTKKVLNALAIICLSVAILLPTTIFEQTILDRFLFIISFKIFHECLRLDEFSFSIFS